MAAKKKAATEPPVPAASTDAPKTLRALVNIPATLIDPADTFGPATSRGTEFDVDAEAAERLVSLGYAEGI